MDSAEKKLLAVLVSADHIIGYTPIGDEPEPNHFLNSRGILKNIYRVTSERNVPPERELRSLKVLTGSVIIFVPGREFDARGTRHGRGGGWYDRFLTMAPRTWVRVGVSQRSAFKSKQLERKSWDEPMDFILVDDNGAWSVFGAARDDIS